MNQAPARCKMKYSLLLGVLLIIHAIAHTQESTIFPQNSSGEKKTSPLILTNKAVDDFHHIRVIISDPNKLPEWLNEKKSILCLTPAGNKNIIEIRNIKMSDIRQLKDFDWVEFIDVSDRKAYEERTIENSDLSVNKINLIHAFFPEITGEGLVASVKERPFDTTDIDLLGRIIKSDPVPEEPTLHATFMATFIAGAGNSAPKGKGVAWKSGITSASFLNLLPDDGQILESKNVSVQNHSYGVNQIENYYGIESLAYDTHCSAYPKIVHVFSSGNMGQDTSKTGLYSNIPGYANLTGQFKMSKNTISVGAIDLNGNVAPLSSRGPAYDGRIKPEIVAYGDGGTSDAAALTSGVCILLQHAFVLLNDSLPASSLIKAVIINSADDIGKPGIDFESGYGSLDANGAIKSIIENRFFASSILDDEEKTYTVTVPANCASFKITLAWCDPEAAINASSALVNDLKLSVFNQSSGISWDPWVLSHYPNADSLALPAKRMADHLNNVEQVTLEFPESGTYEIHVHGEKINNTSQDFSIAYEYTQGFEWIYPIRDSQMEAGKSIRIRWQYAGIDDTGTLEYQLAGAQEWTVLDNDIDLQKEYFEWNVPDTNALALIRIKTPDPGFISDTFVISKPLQLKVGYNCQDEVLLQWPTVAGVTNYLIQKVGEKFLEDFKNTQDTFLLLNENEKLDYFYSVSPVISGFKGLSGNTINYALTGVGCYIISFFPISAVTDSVLLELKIASVYRLKNILLQKFVNGNYITIETRIPGKLVEIFEDKNPNLNRNVYRICLERDDQEKIYSDPAEVYFYTNNSLFVYPNPVSANSALNVINGDDEPAIIKLYDNAGKYLYEFESDQAAIKEFPVNDLKTGMYILEVIGIKGKRASRLIFIENTKY